MTAEKLGEALRAVKEAALETGSRRVVTAFMAFLVEFGDCLAEEREAGEAVAKLTGEAE